MGMPESDSNGTARSGVSATYGPYVSSSHRASFRASPPLIARFPGSRRGSRRRRSAHRAASCRARFLEEAPRDDQLLDLRGALVDLGDLGVAKIALHLVPVSYTHLTLP